MAIGVEILTTNISVFDSQSLKTLFSYQEFLEITEAMKKDEFIKFQLLMAEGQPIYQGTFHKKKQLQTFEEDLNEKLEQLVKNKSITALKKEHILQEIYIEATPFKYEKSECSITPKKEEVQGNFYFFKHLKMKPILKYIGLLFIVFCSVFGIGFFINKITPTNQKSQATISSTKDEPENAPLTISNYQHIAKEYPQRRNEIADYLASEKEFQKLAAFEEDYPTEIGAFELAFNQQEWETVIKAKLTDLTEERKTMLAIAFLALGDIKEAELINQRIENKLLSKKIAIAYLQKQDISTAKKIQEELKDENLKKMIDTASIYEEMVNHYKAENDSDKQKIWEEKFKNFGMEAGE